MSSDSHMPPLPAETTSMPEAQASSPTTAAAPMPSRTSSTTASPPPPQPRRTQSISDPNLRVCFICLLNSNETPDLVWVNPCPCTLEAHEDCFLKWVAQMEASGNAGGGGRRGSRNKGGLRCPACKSVIRVYEPFDPMLWLRDRAHRTFSRVSPVILLSMMGSFAVAGSAHYGITAMSFFAGGHNTMQWLRVSELSRRPNGVALWSHGPTYAFVGKAWLLHLIAPGLLLNKAIPGIDTYLLLPVSLAYGFSLAARDRMPLWPPSPEWAMTVMPCISLSYSHIYYTFFGRFERRLNNILRGTQVEEEAEEQQPQQQRGQHQGRQQRAGARAGRNNNNNNDGGDNHNDDYNIGIGTALFRLAGAFINLFIDDGGDDEDDGEAVEADPEELIEVDVGLGDDGRLQIEVHGDAEAAILEANPEVRAILEEAVEAVQEDLDAAAPAADNQERPNEDVTPAQDAPPLEAVLPAEDAPPPEPQEAAQQPAAVAQEQAPAAPAPDVPLVNDVNEENRNRPQRQRQVGAGNGGGPFSNVVNGTVSALLLPEISYLVGELLRVTLPSRWVRASAWGKPKGLLQERWGRSLIGGCLFVVVRDALVLYCKYRQVQLRKNRRVKNVERRVGGSRGATSSTAS